MSLWKRRALIVALIAITLGVPAVTYWRYSGLTSAPSGDEYWGLLGAAAFAKIQTTRLASADQIASLLEKAYVVNPDLVSSDQRHSLLTTSGELLEVCFLADSPEANLAWRERYGFKMKSRDVLLSDVGVGRIWEAHLHEPVPADKEPLDWFNRLWTVTRAYGDGANRIVAIAADDDGLIVSLANRADDNAPFPRLYDAPQRGPQSIHGPELWVGGSDMAALPWWKPKRTPAEIISSTGGSTFAAIGIIAEFADGQRRPIRLSFYWDPVDQRWLLERFGTSNPLPGSKATVVVH